MARRVVLVVLAAVLGLTGAPVGAGHVPAGAVVVAGPGGFAAGYATPVVVTLPGERLLFANNDVADHNVVSRATVLKRVKVGKRYTTIRVRLFASRITDTGQSSDVVGVRLLKPGSYAFLCSIHPRMTGQLEVRRAP